MITNFYPISGFPEQFRLRFTMYSDEQLQKLRAEHNATHSFFRDGDRICVAWMEGAEVDIGSEQTVNSADHPDIVAGLVRHLLFRTFIRQLPALKPLDFYPLRFVSRQLKHDGVRELLPDELKGIVSYQRLIEVQTRLLRPSGVPSYGVLINMHRRWNVCRNLRELRGEGFNVVGCAVVHKQPVLGLEEIVEHSETSVGRVASVDGNLVQVDTVEGVKGLPLDEVFLRKSGDEVWRYLAFKLGDTRADQIFNDIFRSNPLSADAHTYQGEITDVAEYLSQWDFSAPTGFGFTVAGAAQEVQHSLNLVPTNLRFDISPGAASNKPLSGLLKFGPYDSRRFTPKTVNVLVVCQASSRAGFTTAMGALENGIPDSRYFQKGLRDLFRLNGIRWTIVESRSYAATEFCRVIEEALREHANTEFHLAVVEGSEDAADANVMQNPYYRAKALLMGAGIPVQAIKTERTRLRPAQLADILGPLALQVYAKLGGTPWALESGADVDREIVVGVGHYIERDTEFSGANVRRVVGLSTFFSSDGSFIMANTCRAVDYEGYFNELLTGLESSMRQLAEDYGWKPGEYVRLVFHVFKPLKYTEADVVAELIKRFPEYRITYAFVTIASEHPYLMFDHQARAGGQDSRYDVPDRMSNWVLDDLSCLVQLRGKSEKKVVKHGFPHPALITIHPSSTFRDLHYIAQQVADFTRLSWRTFFPTYLPVTILFGNFIAKMLEKIRGLPGWNPLALNTSLKRKKWFL